MNKEKPILFSTEMVRAILDGRKTQTRRVIKKPIHCYGNEGCVQSHSPYGQVGDILWVRETWTKHEADLDIPTEYKLPYLYKANFPEDFWKKLTWKPSIFMPKDACRIKLRITNVRVERLQHISREDAIAEGSTSIDTPIIWFFDLWSKINGEKSILENPWVWVIEFERAE